MGLVEPRRTGLATFGFDLLQSFIDVFSNNSSHNLHPVGFLHHPRMSQSFNRLPTQVVKLSFPLRSRAQIQRICPQCAHRLPSLYTRDFTTTRRRNAGAVVMKQQQTNVDSKLPKHVSMRSQMKKASKQQIGTDLGFLPQTLILPPASQLPPWTKLKRYKIHFLQLKTSIRDFVS